MIRYLILGAFAVSVQAQELKERYLQRIDSPEKFEVLDFRAPLTLLVVWKADCKECSAPLKEAQSLQNNPKFKGLALFGLYSDIWSSYFDRGKTQTHSSLPQLHDPDSRFLKKMRGIKHGEWVLIESGGYIAGEARTANERKSMIALIQRKLSAKVK